MKKRPKRLEYEIDPSIAKEFKKTCCDQDTTMSAVMRQLIVAYINQHKTHSVVE